MHNVESIAPVSHEHGPTPFPDSIPSDAVADLVSRLVASTESILLEMRGGRIWPRYLKEGAAAVYCGFEAPGRPEPKHRAFRQFCEEEGLEAKPGNGGRGYIFSVADLDRAMTTRRVLVTR